MKRSQADKCSHKCPGSPGKDDISARTDVLTTMTTLTATPTATPTSEHKSLHVVSQQQHQQQQQRRSRPQHLTVNNATISDTSHSAS